MLLFSKDPVKNVHNCFNDDDDDDDNNTCFLSSKLAY